METSDADKVVKNVSDNGACSKEHHSGLSQGSRDTDDMTSKAISIICKELKLAECKTFCRTLDVTEVEIDTIMNNNPHDTETQKYKMLDLWMRRCGSKDTASILYDKLFEMEFLNAAEKVKSLPQSQGSTTSVDDIASGIQEVSLGSTAYDECPLGTQESSTNLKKGPRRPRTMKIKNLKYSELDEFCSDMSVERENNMDWRGLAEKFGYNKTKITLWEQRRTDKPKMKLVLSQWEVRNEATIGKLYDVLVEMGLSHIADEHL